MNRRHILEGAGALLAQTVLPWEMAQAEKPDSENTDVLYGRRTLPAGIRSRQIVTGTGVSLHILEAGYVGGVRPQSPGAFEGMRTVCSKLLGVHLIAHAGHSLGEERPEQVNEVLLGFLRKTSLMVGVSPSSRVFQPQP